MIDAVVEEARPERGMAVLDMGCGSGQLTLPLARRVAHVVAVDVSAAMIQLLLTGAAREGLGNVEGRVAPLEALDLPPSSFDLVVSNYALHHLADEDKVRLLRAVREWLRPGGRLVVGDLMLGRGRDPRDRAIIAEKVRVLAARGPGGWWRICNNAWRFMARTSERPLSVQAWERLALGAGFVEVVSRPIVSEGAIVSATRPSRAA